MDFGALPPEVNSGRMHVGPGAGSMLAASAAWDALGAELHSTVSGYQSVITGLTDESWMGPSYMAMAGAVAPYLVWMTATAAQCEEAASQATAAAAAYETAFAMTVPPPMVVVNRGRLAALIATNILGQNTPAIMATEAEYAEMWAQDATAMYLYAASSASAAAFAAFTPPPQATNPGGLGAQAGAVVQAAGTEAQTTSMQLMSSVPQTLQALAGPGASGAGTITSSGVSSAASAPIAALSSLTGVSGTGGLKGIGKSAGALEGAVIGLSGLSGSQLGLVEDSTGLGMDAVGLVGLDGGGVGLDLIGVGLDSTAAGELSQSEGLGAVGGVSGAAASAASGKATSLGTLSVPQSWADALSVPAQASVLDANVMPGAPGAMPASATISKMPMGGMVGRTSEDAVQRIGMRASVIPHSPEAG